MQFCCQLSGPLAQEAGLLNYLDLLSKTQNPFKSKRND